MSALSAGRQIRRLAGGADGYAGQKGSTVIYAGGVVMLNASGLAIPGAATAGSLTIDLFYIILA